MGQLKIFDHVLCSWGDANFFPWNLSLTCLYFCLQTCFLKWVEVLLPATYWTTPKSLQKLWAHSATMPAVPPYP